MLARVFISQREKNNSIVAYKSCTVRYAFKERARPQSRRKLQPDKPQKSDSAHASSGNITQELLEVKAAKQQTVTGHEEVSKRLRQRVLMKTKGTRPVFANYRAAESVGTRFIHSMSRKHRYCALTCAISVPMLYGLI